MKRARSRMHVLPSGRLDGPVFRTGVSLHSHTMHSKEQLKDLPQYLERMPVVAQFLEWERERHQATTGEGLDFSRAYWRGPVCARTAHDLERRQIEQLDLGPIVSLTDHDNIDASLVLKRDGAEADVPISLEWTVPYEKTCFHIGIYNLRASESVRLTNEMAGYTSNPRREVLRELLERLDRDREVLIVFNHPLWDIGGVGFDTNAALAGKFLEEFLPQIHALEINGLRCWQENMGTISLAESSGLPVVSGGDRHGFEPNATLNLTRAGTFAEFISEIREDRSSDVAIMPQYREPLPLRHLASAWDLVREDPRFAVGERWSERVFVRGRDGIERRLCEVWAKSAHQWIDPCLKVMGVLASPQFRGAVRWAFPAAGSSLP
jgi:hypothetical protein